MRSAMTRGWLLITAMVLAVTAIGPSVSTTATAAPDGGALGAAWTATQDGPKLYPNVHITWDVPITMSDGTVLKANIYRPADANGPINEPFPTIVNVIPYTKLMSMVAESALSIPVLGPAITEFFRGLDMTGTPLDGLTDLTRVLGGGLTRSFAADRNLIQSGYTQVVVDTRGTGFSQGKWEVLGPREQEDTVEVVNWAAAQPWSNGKIGMNGVSYSAINQLQTAEKHPEPLQAIFPVEPGGDLIRDLLAPGGAFGFGFLVPLVALVNTQKLLPDMVSIALGKFDWTWLADRIADPLTFVDVILQILSVTAFEQADPKIIELLATEDTVPRQAWQGDPTGVQVPTMIVGSWHDIFANSEPKIYERIPLPPGEKQLVMGNGYHVTGGFDMRGRAGEPPRIDVLQRAWFDKWLKGIDNGIDTYGPVTMWQQGGNWTTSDDFPRAGVEHQRMYLSSAISGTATSRHDGSLTAGKPEDNARLTVAPGLLSLCSRDTAQITAGVSGIISGCTEDERPHELEGLTFTSAPVAEATNISGPIGVHLNAVHDATDGYWVATVNDVAPDGRSTVLSTGQLVSSMRAIDDSRSKKAPNGDYTDPYHYLTLEQRSPVVPGEATSIDFGIIPTDAVLQPGHRLRVDVFASNFPKGFPIRPMLQDSGLLAQHIQLDPNAPSYVSIPIGGRPGW